MKKPATAIIGACGEYYVAAHLSGHGLIVALPRAGIPGFDLIVSNQRGGNSIRIQVKTGTQSTRNAKGYGKIYVWPTSYTAIEHDDPNLWYAYVWLNNWPMENNPPEVFFVPSNVVVKVMMGRQKNHDAWPWFWITEKEALNYKGNTGFKLLKAALE